MQLKLNKSLSVNFFKYLKFIQLRSNKLKVRPRKIKQDQKCLKFIFFIVISLLDFSRDFFKSFSKKKSNRTTHLKDASQLQEHRSQNIKIIFKGVFTELFQSRETEPFRK